VSAAQSHTHFCPGPLRCASLCRSLSLSGLGQLWGLGDTGAPGSALLVKGFGWAQPEDPADRGRKCVLASLGHWSLAQNALCPLSFTDGETEARREENLPHICIAKSANLTMLAAWEAELRMPSWRLSGHCHLTHVLLGLADTVWWWRVSVGTGPTSTAWSSCCRRR
jgi:hypothetical protein